MLCILPSAPASVYSRDSQLEQLSTEFFLQIPAADAAIVESQENVQTKMDMLNMLSDIALTQKLLKQKKKKEREKKTVVGARYVISTITALHAYTLVCLAR